MTTSDARKRNAERKAAMTPADEIRQAAEKLREMAGAATPGPWRADPPHGWDRDCRWHELLIYGPDDRPLYYGGGEHGDDGFKVGDGDFIAMMDPTLALLVADMLDEAAAWAEELPGWADTQALALARHINGRTA